MFLWRYYKINRTVLIIIGCLAFLVGLALPKLQIVCTDYALLVFGLSLLLWCKKRWWLISIPAVVAAGLMFGLWRGSVMQVQIDGYKVYANQKVVVQGVVREDPSRDKYRNTVLMLGDIKVNGQNMPGTMRITTAGIARPLRGDRVEAEGKLRDGFASYQGSMFYAEVTVVQKQASWIENLRHNFSAKILSILPEPQASLALGFLLGLKSQLPEDLNGQLRLLGLTHIVVASGYNLTILVRLSRRLFARFSKYQATVASGAMIAFFVCITGFSASMSRAALVTGLSIAAWYYGRKIHPVVLLMVSSAITAAINPVFLWGDAGWWLSFLAFAGVMLGAPLLQARIFGKKQPPLLIQVAIETICAQLLTLPYILFVFGNLSVTSVFANVLVVPFIPAAMLLTFIAGVVSWALPGIAALVAQPALWILTYMTNVAELLAKIPWASINVSVSLSGMLLLLGCVGFCGLILYKKLKFDYLQASVVE